MLGDEIYYRDQFPWIWGQLNQLHGRIDIQFGVKGTRSSAMMRFKSERRERMGFVSPVILFIRSLCSVTHSHPLPLHVLPFTDRA